MAAASFNAACGFKNVRNRILSFCCARDLKTVEAVCKLTNNKAEIRNIVAVIRRGLVGTKSAKEIAEIRAALIHLCYMTENLKHQADAHRRNLFIQSNACEVVAQLLRLPQYQNHAGLQEEACWALHHLAREKEGKRRMVKEEVHKLVCRTLGHPDFLSHSGVQRKAMGVVINLANDDAGLKLLVQEGVCQQVVSALGRRGFTTLRELQLQALWCIYNLAWDDEAQQPLRKAGAVEAVLKALHNPVVLKSHSTLEIALAALRNLTSHAETAATIIASGAHKVVLALCLEKNNQGVAAVHEQALWTIMNLTCSGDAFADFLRAGVCQLVYDELKLQKFANNPKIVDPVVGIVFNLLRCREAAVEFIRLDILKHVKRAVEHFSDHEEIPKWGNQIIEIMDRSSDLDIDSYD